MSERIGRHLGKLLLACGMATLTLPCETQAQMNGPLRRHPTNPRYFTDNGGRAIYLTGSHEWLNFIDGGRTDPPPKRDYPGLMHFMRTYNHNFHRFWAWEQAKWICEQSYQFWFSPMMYKRTGPGLALDGKPKFNLDSLDQSFFDRMRARVIMAADSGVYCAVMLYDGWSIERRNYGLANPWEGHPYNVNNNVNGINPDLDGNGEGKEFHTYQVAVWPYQMNYIRKVVTTLNDLDNVLYEISNESPATSISWQRRIVDSIRAVESRLPKQHPVGITGDWGINNTDLFNSNADWISPGDNGSGPWRTNPPDSRGSKVVIVDTDHLWGIGGERDWIWRTFLRGNHTLWMDMYDGSYGWDTSFDSSNAVVVNTRKNMGYTLNYARKIDLALTTPSTTIASTGFCLANMTTAPAELLVYQPAYSASFTVNLGAVQGVFTVEWFNPATGVATDGGTIDGGATRTFTPPFGNDAVLYLKQRPSLDVRIDFPAPPEGYALKQNYPNPFNPSTTIIYELMNADDVRLLVYDTTGKLIVTLVHARQEAGRHTIVWEGKDEGGNPAASGMYFCQLMTRDVTLVRKMLLVR